MKKIFEIIPSSINADNCVLICEMSNEGFSFTIKDETDHLFSALGVYHFDKTTPPVGFPIALQILFHQNKLLSEKFKKVTIVYSFSQSVLIPFSIYNSQHNNEALNLIHGDVQNNSIVLTDVIAECSMYNSYRIPSSIYNIITQQFPDASHMHQYSALLQQPISERNKLSIIFYVHKIVVALIKDGKYQLINCYNYSKAEDVTYVLLNICKQFEVENIDLQITGLLEKNSALYKEIYKYFQTIDLNPLPENKNYTEEITQHPAHYFSHIFALDLCE